MYLPDAFAVTDPRLLSEVMRTFPFATLVSGGDRLFASHLPFILDFGHPPFGRLRAHVARTNPHWLRLQAGTEVLVIFEGPHAYVSPRWYASRPAVPTWNYVVVHAYGRPRLVEDVASLRRMTTELTAQFEPNQDVQDGLDSTVTFQDRMLGGLVGFEIEITRLEGKFKLSQNRPASDVAGVIHALAASAEPNDQATARWMRRFAGA